MWKNKLNNRLYLNSVYLILATGAMAGFGFIFWLINAKLFSTTDIGIATAIIPAANMIALGSLLGLDASIVRFIHNRSDKAVFVRSSIFAVTLLSIVGSIVFGLMSKWFSPLIFDFFSRDTNYTIFILLTVTSALNIICDSIYLANKRTLYTLIITLLYSILKSVFPLLFYSFGSSGILLAAAAAQAVGLGLNFYILNYKWHYFSNFSVNLDSLSGVWKYTTFNYISNIFGLIPYSVVPIIIVNQIGVAESAYYYIAMMVANLLFVISSATTKSLFAEGSDEDKDLASDVKKSVYFILTLTLPAIIILYFIAEYILHFFGSDYGQNGTFLLQILGATAIPIAIYSVSSAIFRIHKKTNLLLICNIFLCCTEIGLVYFFVKDGLNGVAVAILLANTLAAIVAATLAYFSSNSNDKQ
jgi:O-antigen/teichoic acid export membrane protein